MLPDLMLVDDSPSMIQVLGRMLAGTARVRFATNGAAAIEQLRRSPADLILLDAEMPGMDGFELCARLKDDPALADVPVIFVTGHSDATYELRGLDAGAVDFIAKPVSEPLLLARVRTQLRVKKLTDELRQMAAIDGLTGLANRRAFDRELQREWQRAQRDGHPLALLLIDVDHFKKYNDHYGHPAGDACLQAVAQALKSASPRAADLAARYGGEEFALLLPQTDLAGAELVARRALDAVARLALPHAASPTGPGVSISVGLSLREPGATDPSQPSTLLAQADGALYAAKAGGRACAYMYCADGPVPVPPTAP